MAHLQENGLQSTVSVRALQWGSDIDSFEPPFDVIIASDLLYDMKAIPELMLTIVSLSSSDTTTYLAFELRPNVIRAAFQAMVAYGLQAEQVSHCNYCCCMQMCTSHLIVYLSDVTVSTAARLTVACMCHSMYATCRFCNHNFTQIGRAMTLKYSSLGCRNLLCSATHCHTWRIFCLLLNFIVLRGANMHSKCTRASSAGAQPCRAGAIRIVCKQLKEQTIRFLTLQYSKSLLLSCV